MNRRTFLLSLGALIAAPVSLLKATVTKKAAIPQDAESLNGVAMPTGRTRMVRLRDGSEVRAIEMTRLTWIETDGVYFTGQDGLGNVVPGTSVSMSAWGPSGRMASFSREFYEVRENGRRIALNEYAEAA